MVRNGKTKSKTSTKNHFNQTGAVSESAAEEKHLA
jgi:hypothetical protein